MSVTSRDNKKCNLFFYFSADNAFYDTLTKTLLEPNQTDNAFYDTLTKTLLEPIQRAA
jgi:hypothetical protein